MEGSRDLAGYPILRDVPSREFVAIEATKQLYKYSGAGPLEPIPGSDEAEIGRPARVFDVGILRKVLVVTSRGLFELPQSGPLVPIPLPAPLMGATFDDLVELPRWQVALVFTDRGIFRMEAEGHFSYVEGSEAIRRPNVVVEVPGLDAVFVSTYGAGNFLIYDSELPSGKICRAQP